MLQLIEEVQNVSMLYVNVALQWPMSGPRIANGDIYYLANASCCAKAKMYLA